jgi:hypothetical protein
VRRDPRARAGARDAAAALQIAPDKSEHEIELAVFRLRVRLLDGTACVPWDPRLRATLETLAGAPVAAARIHDDRALALAVAAPGTYRVRVPPIDGYEPAAERLVELRAPMTELDIDLVRRR